MTYADAVLRKTSYIVSVAPALKTEWIVERKLRSRICGIVQDRRVSGGQCKVLMQTNPVRLQTKFQRMPSPLVA